MDQLRISYEPDDEWFGKITVRVNARVFTGEASAWINASDIIEFAKSLDRYPLSVELPSILEAGVGGSVDGNRAPQTSIRIVIKPHGARGELLVQAELQSEIWRDADTDLHGAVTARFLTEYALMERFARQLEGVALNRSEEAVLDGKVG